MILKANIYSDLFVKFTDVTLIIVIIKSEYSNTVEMFVFVDLACVIGNQLGTGRTKHGEFCLFDNPSWTFIDRRVLGFGIS